MNLFWEITSQHWTQERNEYEIFRFYMLGPWWELLHTDEVFKLRMLTFICAKQHSLHHLLRGSLQGYLLPCQEFLHSRIYQYFGKTNNLKSQISVCYIIEEIILVWKTLISDMQYNCSITGVHIWYLCKVTEHLNIP